MTLWTPLNAASPYSWLKSKIPTTEYTMNVGIIVGTIIDKTGLGHGAASYVLSGCQRYSGGPPFYFPGSSAMETSIANNLNTVCFAWLGFIDGGAYVSLLGSYDGSQGYAIAVDSNASLRFDIMGTANIFATSNGSIPTGATVLIVVTRNTSTGAYECRVNGTSIASGTYSISPGAGSGTANKMILGAAGGTYGFADVRDFLYGQVNEVVVLDAYDTTTIQKLEGYMLWDWGLQSQLPVGHPYYSAAPTAGSAVTMAATAASVASATAALSLQKAMAGAAQSLAVAGASLSLVKGLAGSATGIATASAILGVQKALAAAAQSVSTGTASLAITKSLEAAASAITTATAALEAVGGLSGNATVLATANAALQVDKYLAADASSQANATASIGYLQQLAATAEALATASAALDVSSGTTISASAFVEATATAALQAAFVLAGAATAIASASASLIAGTAVNLAANASNVATGSAALRTGSWQVIDELEAAWLNVTYGAPAWNLIVSGGSGWNRI